MPHKEQELVRMSEIDKLISKENYAPETVCKKVKNIFELTLDNSYKN